MTLLFLTGFTWGVWAGFVLTAALLRVMRGSR